MTDNANDTTRIERDLHATRERLSADLDALQRRLSPGQMVDQALDYVKGDAAMDIGRSIGRSVSANPLPVALIGVGIAWLMVSRSRETEHDLPYERAYGAGPERSFDDEHDNLGERARRAADALSRGAEETADAFRWRMLEAKGRILSVQRHATEDADAYSRRVDAALGEATDRFERLRNEWTARGREAVQDLASRGSDALQTVKDGLSAGADAVRSGAETLRSGVAAAAGTMRAGVDTGAQAMHGAGDMMRYTGDTLRGTSDSVIDMFRRNPLLLGALGITVGGVLGALLPSTQRERQAFGGAINAARDSLREGYDDLTERAGRVANEVVDAGRKAAGDVMEAGRKAAEDEGLTPEQLAGRAESTVDKAGDDLKAGATKAASAASGLANGPGTSTAKPGTGADKTPAGSFGTGTGMTGSDPARTGIAGTVRPEPITTRTV